MTASELLATLTERGVSVRVDGPDLVLTPGSAVPPELVPSIREAKAELLALVAKAGEPRQPAERVEPADPAPEIDPQALWLQAVEKVADQLATDPSVPQELAAAVIEGCQAAVARWAPAVATRTLGDWPPAWIAGRPAMVLRWRGRRL